MFLASKGRSHMLIRKKMASNFPEIQTEETEEGFNSNRENDSKIKLLQAEILKLRDKLEQKDAAQEKPDKYADLLNDLFHKGIIDSTGNLSRIMTKFKFNFNFKIKKSL